MPYMKRLPKWTFLLAILTVFLNFLPNKLSADPIPQNAPAANAALAGDPGNPCTDPLDYCPIDSGLSALLIIGVGYGLKKVMDSRRMSAASLSTQNNGI
jgi:hypothetical protein